MDSLKTSFLATEFCVLCHERFPLDRVSGPNAWQSMVRAVLYLNVEGEGRIELTESTYLPSNRCDVNVALTRRPRTKIITISRELRVNQTCEGDRMAFCFHSWCYSVLKGVLKWESEECFIPVIYKLARALAPNPSIWEDIQERRHVFDSKTRLRILSCHKEQPLFMSRLPTELKTYIWGYTGLKTPYSAFLLVKVETSRLVAHLRYPPSRRLIPYQGPSLSANMVSVFGMEYIQDFRKDGDSGWSHGDATGLKYITSFGGLCAIQFFGIDWESDWIGKVPSVDCVWHGIIRGDISTLRFEYSDLNCTAVLPAEPLSKSQVVWDQADFPSTLLDPDATLFDFDRDFIRSVRRNAKRRFFRYVSLYCNGEHTKGLSVYVSGRGIVGLEVHFNSVSRLSGHRRGCALHFSLCPDERIAYMWLRVVNSPSSAFAAPAIAIETTSGRRHTFGSYILPTMVTENGYKWILLRQEGYVAGLYYENVQAGITILRLGATGDGTTQRVGPLNPQYHNCGFPSPPIGTPNAGLFLSFAALHGLERVDMCRIENRCTGLLIHYLSGRTSVLGQWHVSCASQRSCIYDSDCPVVSNIYFEMSRYRDRHIVTGVSFTPSKAGTTSDSEYRVFGVGEDIAWWFSERYDEILRWTGQLQDIPKKSRTEQVM